MKTALKYIMLVLAVTFPAALFAALVGILPPAVFSYSATAVYVFSFAGLMVIGLNDGGLPPARHRGRRQDPGLPASDGSSRPAQPRLRHPASRMRGGVSAAGRPSACGCPTLRLLNPTAPGHSSPAPPLQWPPLTPRSTGFSLPTTSADVLEALRLLLKGEGYQIETVKSPAAVIKAARGARLFAGARWTSTTRATRPPARRASTSSTRSRTSTRRCPSSS